MLDKKKIPYRYRDYRQEPLSQKEIRHVLGLLGAKPHAVLRRNDKAFKQLGLTGEEDARTLIRHMADHPTLLQRPIGVYRKKAAVGRPPEALLDLVKPKT
ncbi:MAG: arsenate reductase (glutaredoxin) [Gemmatimonadales bacterium]|nr:arsenate reductase (glutaredoxin) [Gemmatimonadales bacterium]